MDNMLLRRKRRLIILGLMMLNMVVKKEGNNNPSKKNLNKLNLPSFTNTFIVKSSMKGRIRFQVPMLKNNKQVCELLIEQLKNIKEISKAEINIKLGTILIKFDDKALDGETIEGALMKILKLDKELTNRVSTIREKSSYFIEAINSGIYDYSKGLLDIKTLVLLYFLGSAVYDLKLRGRHVQPDYLTLLWWGSSLF